MTGPTWRSDSPPEPVRLGPVGWAVALIRGAALALVVFGGLSLLLILRLVERPLSGPHRPWTPHITVAVCRLALVILGLGVSRQGTPMAHPGALVANHSSWLDIFVLNASGPLYFVSKSEVADWPGIGWLARATGTVFVRRDRREARAQTALLEARLEAGHRLLFFPEGTSSDGRRVLPFKPTLFAALFSHRQADLWVQPATLVYHAPQDRESRHYGWWGDMEFGPHLLTILGTLPQGRVDLVWHTPRPVADFTDRKALARAAEDTIRAAHPLGSADSLDEGA